MSVRNKKIAIAVLFILAFLIFYINRSYAHIFDYDRARDLLNFNLQREYSVGEGNQSLKYVAIGDSLTYGFGAKDKESTFPYIVAKNISQKNKKVEVHNLGVSGAITDEILTFQLPKAVELQPDFVTVMTGTNDVHDFVDKENFRKSLEEIIDHLQKETHAQILLINIPYLGTEDLILPPHNLVMDERIKEFNKVIEEVAQSRNVELIDLYSKSKTPFQENPKLYYSIDEFHPSDEGYILWGNLINGN